MNFLNLLYGALILPDDGVAQGTMVLIQQNQAVHLAGVAHGLCLADFMWVLGA